MKRLSLILIVALVAGMFTGCRFAIVESDSLRVGGHYALAEEGETLFNVEAQDFAGIPVPEDLEPIEPEATEALEAEEPASDEKMDEAEAESQTFMGLHSQDEEGEDRVRRVQQRLMDLGYLSQEPDGVFGSRTLNAMLRFQKDAGLKRTGVLDDETRLALFPQPAVTTAPEDLRYAEGAFGAEIRIIQRRLRQYGFSTRAVSGRFDEYTAEEVQAFQSYAVENYGTEFDDPGQLDLPEEPALVPNDGPGEPETTPEPTPDPSDDAALFPDMPALEPVATLKPDHAVDGAVSHDLYNYILNDRFPVYNKTVQTKDEGIEVKRVQSRLKILDYYYGDVDGLFGESTETALKTFQKHNDLQQTGIADIETQQKLFSTEAVMAEQVAQPFYIKVSIAEQRVYVYRWDDGDYRQLIRTMICSTGYGNTTPKGVFVSPGHRDARWHYFAEFNCWAQYAFIIKGSILFHSVIYSGRDESTLRTSTLHNLGHKASHGCVRLMVEDAKWIYEHCGEGQVIEIY